MPVRSLFLALPLALAACAGTPTTSIAPVEPLRYLDSELLIRPATRGLEQPDFVPLLDDGDAQSARFVSVRARFLSLDPGVADQILGAQASTLLSFVLTRERADRLLRELEVEQPEFELLTTTTLFLHEAQEGYVSVVNQRAYVAGFSVRSSGQAALADPQVEVAMQGSVLTASGSLDESGETVTLQLSLDTCELDEDFAVVELALAGGRVQLQEPRGLIQRLSTHVQLGRDEALLVGGASLSSRDPRRALFVLVEAEQREDPLPSEPGD